MLTARLNYFVLYITVNPKVRILKKVMTEKAPEETEEINDDTQPDQQNKEGCCAINKAYLVSKVFYFFFFSAQGSLLPYLALFFKQLELPASQIGAITGMKPYIAFFFIPFWGCVADRFKKGKLLFVVSMIAVILGMVAYALVPINICETESTVSVSRRAMPRRFDDSSYSKDVRSAIQHTSFPFHQPDERPTRNMKTRPGDDAQLHKKLKLKREKLLNEWRHSHISKLIRKVSSMEETMKLDGFNENLKLVRFNVETSRRARQGSNNETSLDGVSEMADESLEETPWSQSDMIALQGQKSKKNPPRRNTFIFLYLLLATIFSTILSCPSLTLADTATVNLLKQNDETHKYGKQRMWGSVGYGSMAFLVGSAVSRTHLCPPGSARRKDVNYYPCFAMYVVYNIIALVIGSRFEFNNNGKTDTHETNEEATKDDSHESKEEAESGTRGIIAGLILLARPRHAMFLVTAFYVGITMGFIRVFLFWHLKDLGGTQILFSIMTAINCVAEVTLYFLSTKLISYLSTIGVLYLGLTCYSIRLFYYASVSNPWTVLPVELLSGITTAAVWAAMMSYVGTHSVKGASITLQGKHCSTFSLHNNLLNKTIKRKAC